MRQSCDYMIFKFPVTIIEMTFGVTNDIIRKVIHYVMGTISYYRGEGQEYGREQA